MKILNSNQLVKIPEGSKWFIVEAFVILQSVIVSFQVEDFIDV